MSGPIQVKRSQRKVAKSVQCGEPEFLSKGKEKGHCESGLLLFVPEFALWTRSLVELYSHTDCIILTGGFGMTIGWNVGLHLALSA
jgi:hypothetical protein